MKIHQIMGEFLPLVLSEIIIGYMPDNDVKRRFYLTTEDPTYPSRAHLILVETQYALDDSIRKIIMFSAKVYNTSVLEIMLKNFLRRTDESCVQIVKAYTRDKLFKQLMNDVSIGVTITSDPIDALEFIQVKCAFAGHSHTFGRLEENSIVETTIPDPANRMFTLTYPNHHGRGDRVRTSLHIDVVDGSLVDRKHFRDGVACYTRLDDL